MRNSDPNAVINAIDRAEDAFAETGLGPVEYESGISTDADWETQLTKACRLIEVASLLQTQNGYYTAVIEVCFGALERTIEAYCLKNGGDTLRDFQNHADAYRRGGDLNLLSRDTMADLESLYADNRTESYYGDTRPTAEQAASMVELATEVHEYTVNLIHDAGVCICD